MYVKNVKFERYRCFESQSIDLVVPDDAQDELRLPNVTVLLGNNGSGKSSVLSGIALGAMGGALQDSGWVPRGQVRRTREGLVEAEDAGAVLSADLVLDRRDTQATRLEPGVVTVSTGLSARSATREGFGTVEVPDEGLRKEMYDERSPALFLAGYGASRRAESGSDFDAKRQQQSFVERFQRVGGLFLDEFALVPLSAWLPEAGDRRRSEVRSILADTLDEGFVVTEELEQGDLVVIDNGVRLPISAISDGYRCFLSWLGDLIHRLDRCIPADVDAREVPGVVLVDEIALHLHPEWQRRVVPTLARAFPKLQFVFSTHSPLVVGSLDAGNLRVLEKGDDVATVMPAPVSPYGLSGDQVLLSDYFGLREVRDEAFEGELQEVRELAIEGDIDAADELTRMLTLGGKGRSQERQGRKESRR